MKNNKNLLIGVGIVVIVAVVGAAIYLGGGESFQGMFKLKSTTSTRNVIKDVTPSKRIKANTSDTTKKNITKDESTAGNIEFNLSAMNPPASQVSAGADDHEFMRFNAIVGADAVSINEFQLMVNMDCMGSTPPSGNLNELSDVKVWRENSDGDLVVIGGPLDLPNETCVGAVAGTLSFTDSFDQAANTTVEYIVTADVGSNASDNNIYWFQMNTGSVEATYSTSGSSVPGNNISGGVLYGNHQTVAATTPLTGNIEFSLSAMNPPASQISAGANDHEFLRFNASVGADDVSINEIQLVANMECPGFSGNLNELSDIKVWRENSDGELVVVAGPLDISSQMCMGPVAGILSFTDSFDQAANTTAEYIVTADVSSNAIEGNLYWFQMNTGSVEATYSTSGSSVPGNNISGGVLSGNDQTVSGDDGTVPGAPSQPEPEFVDEIGIYNEEYIYNVGNMDYGNAQPSTNLKALGFTIVAEGSGVATVKSLDFSLDNTCSGSYTGGLELWTVDDYISGGSPYVDSNGDLSLTEGEMGGISISGGSDKQMFVVLDTVGGNLFCEYDMAPMQWLNMTVDDFTWNDGQDDRSSEGMDNTTKYSDNTIFFGL